MNHFHPAELRKAEALRKKSPGKPAVLMLAKAAEQDCFIIWSEKDWYGQKAKFFSLQELEEVNIISNAQQTRSNSAIQALINREFLKPIYDGTSLPRINRACMQKGKLPFQMPSPFVRRSTDTDQAPPWSISDDIFEITPLGHTFLAENANRITIYRREEAGEKILVASTRSNNRGVNLVGLGGIYRVIKETSKRFYVEQTQEGIQLGLNYDHSFKAHENRDGIDLHFIRKENVLAQNLDGNQIDRLGVINQELIEAKNRLHAELLEHQANDQNPEELLEDYLARVQAAENFFTQRINQLIGDQDAVEDDGFVLEVCEEEVSALKI